MGHRKRFFVTKSDLIFAALLALAIWLGICWYFGSTNYRLTCRLEERIRVSGVVRTNTGYVPDFDFAYSSNAGNGLHSSEYEPHQSVKEYELMLPGAWAHGSYRSGEWQQDDSVSGKINLSINLPTEWWRAEPSSYVISGPRSDADFELTREPR